MFTVSENMRMQDTWFLWMISAILVDLRYVGDIWNFKWVDLLKIHRQQISSN
jgi:hypothetical protein